MVIFPEGYSNLHRRVEELSKQYSIRSVLDLGCGPGYYVGFLSSSGYDAYGIDVGEDKFLAEFKERLKTGDITALRDAFGDRLFDLIVSHNTLTVDPILFHMMGGTNSPQLGILNLRMLERQPSIFWEVRGSARKVVDLTLESAFDQLNQGGFLVSCEEGGPNDKVDFSRQTAERIGYRVLVYQQREAVLQKP